MENARTQPWHDSRFEPNGARLGSRERNAARRGRRASRRPRPQPRRSPAPSPRRSVRALLRLRAGMARSTLLVFGNAADEGGPTRVGRVCSSASAQPPPPASRPRRSRRGLSSPAVRVERVHGRGGALALRAQLGLLLARLALHALQPGRRLGGARLRGGRRRTRATASARSAAPAGTTAAAAGRLGGERGGLSRQLSRRRSRAAASAAPPRLARGAHVRGALR